MQLVTVAKVTPEYELKLDKELMRFFQPGEKVKVSIESLDIDHHTEENRLKAVERLKKFSDESYFWLYNQRTTRVDAHDREDFPKL